MEDFKIAKEGKKKTLISNNSNINSKVAIDKTPKETQESLSFTNDKVANTKIDFKYKPVTIPINEDDEEVFFLAILNDMPYKKEVNFFNGKMVVGYRTRTVAEIEIITKKITEKNLTMALELDLLLNKYHLYYAVTSIKMKDKTIAMAGTFDERKERLEGGNNQKFLLLLEGMNAFDYHVEQLREKAKEINFSSPVTDM